MTATRRAGSGGKPSLATPGQRTLFEDSRPLSHDSPLDNLRHPAATHETRLAGRPVGYLLRRAQRRSIGMIVTPEGLRVSAPRWVALRDIEAALVQRSGWILAKLAEQGERAVRAAASRVEWRTGATLPYLGGDIVLRLGCGGARYIELVGPDALPEQAEAGDARSAPLGPVGRSAELRLGLSPDAPPDKVARAVQKWLRARALEVFDARCRHYAAVMGVSFTRLGLSSARTRWGSASSNGSIRLHWRLVHFALPTIDYVVVHELAHLREMNHSARFWAIVAAVLPAYEAARSELKTRALPVVE